MLTFYSVYFGTSWCVRARGWRPGSRGLAAWEHFRTTLARVGGGATVDALAVASYAGTTRVRSGVFLGGSTTHDDADDATKKSVPLPEGRGGVGSGHVGRTGIMRHHTTLPTTAHKRRRMHTFAAKTCLRRYGVLIATSIAHWRRGSSPNGIDRS